MRQGGFDMLEVDRFYARGAWHGCSGQRGHPLVDPFTGSGSGEVVFVSASDLADAVTAAREGLAIWSESDLAARRAALAKLEEGIRARSDDLVDALRLDIGCPVTTGRFIQTQLPLNNLRAIREGLEAIQWDAMIGHSRVRRIPIGVVAGLTPWNAPVHQIIAKVAGVIGAGAAIVLKPSEVAPRSALVLTEVLADIGLPPGVFNLVWGGAEIGRRLVGHAGVDMVSFTGSEAVGRDVMAAAALGPKPVALELGGKSAAIVLREADLERAVGAVFRHTLLNAGQVCVCQSRLLVPRERMEQAAEIVRRTAATVRMGDPLDPATTLGPLATRQQLERVTGMVQRATEQGLQPVGNLQAGPVPRGGFFFPPTAFMNVESSSDLAQREVFGPVLAMLGYDDEDEAVQIANATPFGLSGAVWGGDATSAERVASRLRTGQVSLNGAPGNQAAPFGGFGQSGFGRENGRFSVEAFTTYRAIHRPPA